VQEIGARDRSVWGPVFGVVDILSALLVYLGVWQGLPARYWPIDLTGTAILLLLAVAGLGLLTRASWGATFARIASMVTLALGLLLMATLAITASYLSGIYGPVGRGGALILVLVAALSLPYLVVLPAAQLLWIGRWRRGAGDAPAVATHAA
jgi:hypothetical protein